VEHFSSFSTACHAHLPSLSPLQQIMLRNNDEQDRRLIYGRAPANAWI